MRVEQQHGSIRSASSAIARTTPVDGDVLAVADDAVIDAIHSAGCGPSAPSTVPAITAVAVRRERPPRRPSSPPVRPRPGAIHADPSSGREDGELRRLAGSLAARAGEQPWPRPRRRRPRRPGRTCWHRTRRRTGSAGATDVESGAARACRWPVSVASVPRAIVGSTAVGRGARRRHRAADDREGDRHQRRESDQTRRPAVVTGRGSYRPARRRARRATRSRTLGAGAAGSVRCAGCRRTQPPSSTRTPMRRRCWRRIRSCRSSRPTPGSPACRSSRATSPSPDASWRCSPSGCATTSASATP